MAATTDSWLTTMQCLVLLALYRMSCESASIRSPTKSYLVEKGTPEAAITPQQKDWSAKAVQKYTAAQDKNWRRWNEAMFERL